MPRAAGLQRFTLSPSAPLSQVWHRPETETEGDPGQRPVPAMWWVGEVGNSGDTHTLWGRPPQGRPETL